MLVTKGPEKRVWAAGQEKEHNARLKRERNARYNEKHADKIRDKRREYRKNHPEEIREKGREYRENHIEDIRKYQQDYRAKKKVGSLESAMQRTSISPSRSLPAIAPAPHNAPQVPAFARLATAPASETASTPQVSGISFNRPQAEHYTKIQLRTLINFSRKNSFHTGQPIQDREDRKFHGSRSLKLPLISQTLTLISNPSQKRHNFCESTVPHRVSSMSPIFYSQRCWVHQDIMLGRAHLTQDLPSISRTIIRLRLVLSISSRLDTVFSLSSFEQ